MYYFDGDAWIFSILIVISSSIILFMKHLARNDDYWKKRGIPYMPRQSLWTAMKSFQNKTIAEIVLENYRNHGRLYGSFEMSRPVIQLSEPELLKDVLVKDFHIFTNRRYFKTGYKSFDMQITMLRGEDWKRVRTVVTPAFTSKRMRQMGTIINNGSKTLIGTFEKHFQAGKSVDCKAAFGAFTMDVIASAAFATKIDCQNDPDNVFVSMIKKLFTDFSSRAMVLFFLLPSKLVSQIGLRTTFKVMEFFKTTIKEVIRERKKKHTRYNDILQILMDATEENASQKVKEEHKELMEDDLDRFGTIISDKIPNTKYKNISEDEMLAQCLTIFTTGYETSASIMANLAYCLALNPIWQERVIEEVDAAFQKHKEMSYDTVRDMKVLDCVLSETLRMFPPLFVIDREASEDYRLGNTGLIIEKGMSVSVPIYAIHFDPEYFEEPHLFNPQRFEDSRHPPYTYMPFGAGPRNCLGMRFALLEIKMCIANVLRHFRFARAPETQVPLNFKKGFVLLSVDQLPLKVDRRTDNAS